MPRISSKKEYQPPYHNLRVNLWKMILSMIFKDGSCPRGRLLERFSRRTPLPKAYTSSATETETIYEGECRSYRNVVTKTRDGVLVSDYVIAMPRADFAILPGDIVVVQANNRTMRGVVVDSQTTNLGTNIWWNQKEN